MATMIGRLAVALLGDIKDFKQNFAEAKKGVQDFSKEVKKADVDLKRVGRNMTLIGTTIVGSLFAVTKAVADNADQIDLLAKRTGVTREELQKLAYAAKQEGSSIESVSTSLVRLSGNMLNAVRGSEEAKMAFEALGIQIKDANGQLRSADQVMMDIADRFASMTNDTERAAVAMQLFGRGGAEIIPLLRNGRDGIQELKDEAEALGYVLSEEDVKILEKLGDELEAVRVGFGGISRQIAADVAPAFLRMATMTKDLFKWIHLLPDDLRKLVSKGALAAGTILTLGGAMAILITKIAALRTALMGLGTTFGAVMTKTIAATAIFLALGKAYEAWKGFRFEKMTKEELKNVTTLNEALEIQLYLSKEISRVQGILAKRPKDQIHLERLEDLKERKAIIDAIVQQLTTAQFGEGGGLPLDFSESKFDINQFLKDLQKSLSDAEKEVKIFGNTNELASKKADLLKTAIIELIKQNDKGQYNKQLAELVSQYKTWAQRAEIVEKELEREQQSLNLIRQAQQEVINWNNRHKSSLELLAEELERQASLENKNKNALLEYANAMRELDREQKAFNNQKAAYEAIFTAQEKLAEMTGQCRKEWEDFADELERLAGAEGVIESTSNALLKLADAIRQAGEDNEAKELQKQLAQIAHETAQFELDTQITQLENQKALLAIQGDSLENREKELELNKQIAQLQIEKLNLDIASLEAQKEKAAATQNEAEVQRINLEIAKMRAAIEGYQFQVELDTARYQQQLQQPITNLQNELRGATSSALAAGLQDGGVIGAIDSLGDYMANKFRTKIADAMTDALFNTTFGQNFESFFTRLFGGAAAANAGAQAGDAGAAATGTAAAGGLAGFFASPWALALGGLGLIGSLFAGSRGSTTINIQASAGHIVADYATANFKEVVLPSSYMGQGVPSSAVAPVYNVNVSVTAAGSLIAERDLDKRIQSSVEAGIAKANAKATKWQAVTTVSG